MQFPIQNLSPEKNSEVPRSLQQSKVWNVTVTTNLGIGLWGTIITTIIWSWEVPKI